MFLILSGEEYNACSSALCNFLHSPLTSSLLARNIFLRTLFSNTLNLCSSLKVRVQVSPVLKWKWGGHVSRLQGCRWAHISTTWDPRIGGRNRGRPGTRWADFFKSLAGPLWSRTAKNREEWRSLQFASIDLAGFSSLCSGNWNSELATLDMSPGENLNQGVLRKIFGAKRDEVTGEWRKLHNTELHALYSSPDIISNIKSRRLRWAGHVARMGESRNAYRVLVGRPEGKRPLKRPRRRWEDNIKMDLREVGYDDRQWINLAQDRDQWRAYVRAAMNLRVP
ncbi:hypothetical protein ANN_14926 [Periplaneta americana]|uniref:Uncharacterized protein n=1 Tax=Periplaneta americana TaxID=6978 RepID=A0ABQ8SXN0_PERAM|nr:hypothetical protein ANN_14926 [Periplaneta americana]